MRRRAVVTAFLTGAVLTLFFFGFFPGLPHVIDWGAVLAAIAVGGLAQWGCRRWVAGRGTRSKDGPT